jgi:hypothetical protein
MIVEVYVSVKGERPPLDVEILVVNALAKGKGITAVTPLMTEMIDRTEVRDI